MTRRPALLVTGVVVAIGVVLGLETLSEQHFVAHMLQHSFLIFTAAPLIAASGIPRVRLRWLRLPVVVAILHAAALWAWHLPVLYDAAMESPALHVLEHLSFLVTAVLFWAVVFDRSVDRFMRVAFTFVTMLQSGALGVVIAFAERPLYEWHVANTPTGPLATSRVLPEQQLAGAIMWIPPGVIYLATMLVLLARALASFDTAEQP